MKMMNDLLLIRRLPDPDPTTDWDLLLPPGDEHADTPLRGLVIAAGPGRRPKYGRASVAVADALRAALHDLSGCFGAMYYTDTVAAGGLALAESDGVLDRLPMSVAVGDTIIFSRNGYQEYRIDGEVLLALHEDSVLGVID